MSKPPDLNAVGGPHNGSIVPLPIAHLGGVEGARTVAPVEYLDFEAEVPPVEWILEGWLARGDIAVLAAPPYTGKSTMAAALTIAVSTGSAWCGITPAQPAPVLHYDEEQGRRTVQRMFQALHGRENHPSLRVASGQGMVLTTADGIHRLEREIETHRPAVVVLDTVAQVFAGVELKSLEDVYGVFRQLFRLRELYGCAFLLLTHFRKGGPDKDADPADKVFGSVAFRAGADTLWIAERPGTAALELRQRKRRDGVELAMRITCLRDEAGRVVALEGEPLEQAETARDAAEVLVVRLLETRGSTRRRELIEAAATEHISKATAERALKQLMRTGRVVQKHQRGPYSLAGADPQTEVLEVRGTQER